MKLSATLAMVCLAGTTSTALPVDGNAPSRTFWGMPIIDHTPVRRRSPTMHIVDKVPVPEARRAVETEPQTDSTIAKAFWGMPIIDHTPVPGTRRRAAADDPFPIVDHKPVPDDGN